MANKKKVVITGGTTGIGFACAEYLVKKEYLVIITGKSEINLTNALTKLGNEATGFLSDTSVTVTPIQQKSGMDENAIQNLLDHFSKTSPPGRILQPDDMAPVLEFLIFHKSLVLRNERIVVDGGTTL